MKAIYVIGILAFMLATVSCASASTFYLTETTDDYVCDVPIKVKVDYEGNIIRVEVIEPSNNEDISNVEIKTIWLWNPNNPVIPNGVTDKSDIADTWVIDTDGTHGADYFGEFSTEITQPNKDDKTIGPIEIELENNVVTPINDNGYGIVVHVGFLIGADAYNEGVGCSGKVGGSIPEFPSVVLPVAAIMGIMLIYGRKRKE